MANINNSIAEEIDLISQSDQIKCYKGQIISIHKYQQLNQPVPFLYFILNVQDRSFIVDAGAEWYVLELGLQLTPQALVEVLGIIQAEGNEVKITAQQIKQDGLIYRLRSQDNKPLWHNCNYWP